jgi:ABC-type molybdate transport system ATPase subunit
MQNVELEVKGKKLTITVDLTKDFGPSKSGKTTIIATTAGNVDVPEHPGVKLGLNLYRTK